MDSKSCEKFWLASSIRCRDPKLANNWVQKQRQLRACQHSINARLWELGLSEPKRVSPISPCAQNTMEQFDQGLKGWQYSLTASQQNTMAQINQKLQCLGMQGLPPSDCPYPPPLPLPCAGNDRPDMGSCRYSC